MQKATNKKYKMILKNNQFIYDGTKTSQWSLCLKTSCRYEDSNNVTISVKKLLCFFFQSEIPGIFQNFNNVSPVVRTKSKSQLKRI